MKKGLAAGLLAGVALVAGFVGHQLNEHPRVQHALTAAALEVDKEGTRYLRRFGFSCGVEAWSVKTMTDSAAAAVPLTPFRSTIPRLVALSPNEGQRTTPPRNFLLKYPRLIAYKLEPDSDIHLVLQSQLDPTKTLIAEIPDPQCAQGSVVLAQITAARAAFVAQFGQPQTYFINLNAPVFISGIGFFDFLHGQRGVAPNGIELHPVLYIKKL
jgi:hypothetical protein